MSVLSFLIFRSCLYLYLTASYISMPAQTEALSELTLPNIGSDSTTSQFSLTSFPSPKPSLPITSANAPDKSALSMGVPSASAPYTQTPCFLSVFIVSTRFDTLAIFIHAGCTDYRTQIMRILYLVTYNYKRRFALAFGICQNILYRAV